MGSQTFLDVISHPGIDHCAIVFLQKYRPALCAHSRPSLGMRPERIYVFHELIAAAGAGEVGAGSPILVDHMLAILQ
jgi:hypothetical protein